MKQFSLLLLTLFVFCSSIYAQDHIIDGTVLDKNTGETLIGATILIENTTQGTYADVEGNFLLKTQKLPVTLIIKYIGYKDKKVVVSSVDKKIEIELEEGDYISPPVIPPIPSIKVREVLITALGIERDRKALGYSVQQIESKTLTQVREPNLLNSLAGRVAGVQINNGSSGVGSSTRVVIRGESSLSGNNQALFVVDGVPISNDLIANVTENDATGFQEVDYGNGAGEISADDIKSISVLKGPSATALYGSRAANGVVVIETKDGSNQSGFGISLNSSLTVETPLTMPQYQNVYGQGNGGLFEYEDGLNGGVNDGEIVSFGPTMDGQLIKQYDSPSTDVNGNPVRGGDVIGRNGNEIQATPFIANPNNVRDFFETGMTWINNIALSGGNNNGNIRLSYTNLNNKGILPNTDLKRNSLALSTRYTITPKLKTKLFLNYINSASDNRPAMGYGSENPMYLFTWMGRQVNTESLKDYWQAGQEGLQQYNYNYAWMDNPYLAMYENTNSFGKDRVLGNVSASYDFAKGLSLRIRSGMDFYNDLRESRRAFSTQRFPNGAYREDNVIFREMNTDVLVKYEKRTDNWGFMLSGGANRMDQSLKYKATVAGQLSVPGVYNFENSRNPLEIIQYNERKRINSLYALGQIDFRNQIFLDLTVRNDWSSTLPTGNNSYAYYSASLSAVLSDIWSFAWPVRFWKVRLSGASVGNDTDPYSLNNTFLFGQPYGLTPTVAGSAILQNNQLRPERINSFEVGTDLNLKFYNGAIWLDLTYYNNLSKDQIVSLPASAPSGYTFRVINGGKIRSSGVEAMLQYSPIRDKRDFGWHINLNFSLNRSTVTELPSEIDQYVTGFARVYGRSDRSVFFIVNPDGRMGDMYGTGLEQVDGQNVFDANGNPVKDPNLRLLGNYNPDFIMGIGNTFKYKDLQLGLLFDWRKGGVIVSRTLAIASTSGVLESSLEGREDGVVGAGVTNTGTTAEPNYVTNTTPISAQDYYGQFYDRDNEANAIYDASYVKLREIRLGYTIPQKKARKIGFKAIAISFIARNVALWTENPHFDPELNAMQGTRFAQGVEDMSYPSTRSFGIGLNLKL